MKRFIGEIAVAAALAMAASVPSVASATVYTSQTAFDAANPGLPSTNFDTFASAIAGGGDILFVSNPLVVGGATFSSGGGPGDLYLTNGAFFGGAYSTALSTEGFSDAVTVAFSPVDAVGVELASTYPGDGSQPVTFTLYDGTTQLYSNTFSINDMSSPGFVGFDGLGDITSVVVTAGAYPAFDTIVSVDGVGGVSAIPEPSNWLLMIAGIGGVGMMLRRARKGLGSTSSAAA